MIVYGKEISEFVIQLAYSELPNEFTYRDFQAVLESRGVPEREVSARCADRALQQRRKHGFIRFYNGSWHKT